MDKVRIGFVGVGAMGQMAHLRDYADLEACEVVAIAEMRAETAQLVARRYGVEKVYPDHKAMLEAETLDDLRMARDYIRLRTGDSAAAASIYRLLRLERQ